MLTTETTPEDKGSETTALARTDRTLISIREDDDYRAVVGPYLTEADVIPNVDLMRRHRRTLGRLLVDPSGRILGPYPLWDAVLRLGSADPELGAELMDDVLDSIRVVEVSGLDEAATLIRAVSLCQDLGTRRANLLIVDQVLQQLAWIASHRAEIDERNPSYSGREIRPSASWVGNLVGADNKKVERLYWTVAYGLQKYAELPSLGANLIIQKGAGSPRGRRKRNKISPRTSPFGDPSVPRSKASSESAAATDPEMGSEVLDLSGATPASCDRRGHPVVEAVRRILQAKTDPLPISAEEVVEPGRRSQPNFATSDFTGGVDQMPPCESAVPLGDGGQGIYHLYRVARLLEAKTQDREAGDSPGWEYVKKVLGAFAMWTEAWIEDRKAGGQG